MSAYGTKRTSLVAPHMSAFGGKADITLYLRDGALCVGSPPYWHHRILTVAVKRRSNPSCNGL